MKTVLLAVGMTICLGIGIACLHLILNYKDFAKSKSKKKAKACPKLICQLLSSEDGSPRQVSYIIVPSILLLSLVVMVWLAFSWEA